MKGTFQSLYALLLLFAALHGCKSKKATASQENLRVKVTYDAAISQEPVSGRVVVIFKRTREEVPFQPRMLYPEPFYSVEIDHWKQGQELEIDERFKNYSVPLSDIRTGKWYVQAVLDVNTEERHFAQAKGNAYSDVYEIDLGSGPAVIKEEINLTIKHVMAGKGLPQSPYVREVNVRSKLLSDHYGKPAFMRGAILLPPSYSITNAVNEYPVVYVIPGFGERYVDAVAIRNSIIGEDKAAGMEKVYVILDADCQYGHHVFADSENNGPRAEAFIRELIPYLERTYRLSPDKRTRFLTGHSSGGWSSLWLQINYPDHFNGVWSLAPDPVDFRDFNGIDIYNREANAFWEDAKKTRPRVLDRVSAELTYKSISDRDLVIGDGEQLTSFDAAFSPRGADKRPKQLWNRETGAIHAEVAAYWTRYDIHRLLKQKGSRFCDRMAGKINVLVGDQDEFRLAEPVMLLKSSLDSIRCGINVSILPGVNHYTIRSEPVRSQINAQIEEAFAAYRKNKRVTAQASGRGNEASRAKAVRYTRQ